MSGNGQIAMSHHYHIFLNNTNEWCHIASCEVAKVIKINQLFNPHKPMEWNILKPYLTYGINSYRIY